MREMYVNFRKIKNSNYELPYLELRTNLVRKRVYRLKEELPVDICERYHIGQRMETLCKDMSELAGRLEQLYKITNYCVEQYEDAEYENEMRARSFY